MEFLNSRHAVVREAGKTVVITEENDPILRRRVLARSSFPDFANFYQHRKINIGTGEQPKLEAISTIWLNHPDRRTFEQVAFLPNQDDPDVYNLWRGFAVKAAPGNWSAFRQHILENLCRGDDGVFAVSSSTGWPTPSSILTSNRK